MQEEAFIPRERSLSKAIRKSEVLTMGKEMPPQEMAEPEYPSTLQALLSH